MTKQNGRWSREEGPLTSGRTPWQDIGLVRHGVVGLMLMSLGLAAFALSRGWLLLSAVLLLLASAVAFTHLRYRRVTAKESVAIAQAGLVHLTSTPPEMLDSDTVVLDPRRCRLRSRAIKTSWPLAQQAVFAFVGEPRPEDVRFNVDRKPMWTVRFVPGADAEMLIRGRAVALPHGYRGPAEVEELSPAPD